MKLAQWMDGIKRLNQLFILLFFLACIAFFLWIMISGYQESKEVKPGEVPVVTKSETETTSVKSRVMSLGNHTRLAGTDTILASVILRSTEAGYRNNTSELHNLLFIYRTDDTATLLFPHNDFVIKTFNFVREGSYEDTDRGNVRAILCHLIKVDRNEDGKLTEEDGVSLMAVSTDGKFSKEILASIESVMSVDTMPNRQISILYQTGGKILNKRIDPVTFETVSDVTLFDLEKAAQNG